MDVSFEEEVALRISRGYHMHIDSERHEEMVSCPPHLLSIRRDPIEPMDTIDPIDPVDPIYHIDVPRDIVEGWKIPTWEY
jgi:hypothetical protein